MSGGIFNTAFNYPEFNTEGAITPPTVVVSEVGVYRPQRIRRVEETVEALLTGPLSLGWSETNAILICSLAEKLVSEGIISSELRSRIEALVVATAQNGSRLEEKAIAVSGLAWELREAAVLDGYVPRKDILRLVKALEDMDEEELAHYLN